ncbi:MAG TPA: hypothetical protein VFB04_02655 [Terriglobales bacterium]|nr:hypothetical protein [Terriglobales bacterium]
MVDPLQTLAGPPVASRDADVAAHLANIQKLVPASVYSAFSALLPGSPDPHSTLHQFERLAETASPELFSLLQKHPSLVHYTVVIFGYSAWLGETLIHNPDLFQGLLRDRTLDRTYSREEFQESFARMRSLSHPIAPQTGAPESADSGSALWSDPAALLARFKRREYVRIMLRDVLGIATLAETTGEISALADVLIEEALREVQTQLQHRFGSPQSIDPHGRVVDARFAVLSLGKLGGNELNYSSDIDLLYLYDGGEEPAGAEISNREYFIRMAQQTTELLARHTREGPVFRLDLRLRPQGGGGLPAVSLIHAVHYYSRVAQDWELQAMIKARHSAGDVGLAREFARAVQPYVYRPEINFAAIKTALETREKIGSHRRRNLLRPLQPGSPANAGFGGDAAESAIDVKVDRGGIRDVEFLVQCLQRVYGGTESWLRSRGTLFALQKLHDKDHIGGKDFHNLTNAYEFLRNLEHRLQLRHGQQTHRLPQSRAEIEVLARSLTREGTAAPTPEEFLALVRRRMSAVAEIYQRVIFREQSQDQQAAEFQLWPEAPATPESTYSQMMQRLAIDAPRLREIALRVDLSQHARRNLDRFFSSAGTTSERYGAVLRSPGAVEKALTIFEFSEFLTEILVRHPEEIALLEKMPVNAIPRTQGLFAAGADDVRPWQAASHSGVQPMEAGPAANVGQAPQHYAADPVFQHLARGNIDASEAMAVLRRHYRQRLVMSGALDLFPSRDVFDSLRDNTAAADAAIQAALAIAGAPAGFAVLGLGRLGAGEFDLLSDADVLFVSDNKCDRDATRRAAERLMEALTAYTRDGTVFSVDARLRPHGREGELVITPQQLAAYFRDEAHPWEALTYVKLRPVAGDGEVAQHAVAVVEQGAAELAHREDFAAQLRDLRQRLERSDTAPNLKTGPGGVYDLDYLAGALQAEHRIWLTGTLLERLRALQAAGLLQQEEFECLASGAHFLRTVEHVVRLVTGRARKWLPVADHPRRAAQKLLWRVLGANDSFDPEMRLTELMRQTREIYTQKMGS